MKLSSQMRGSTTERRPSPKAVEASREGVKISVIIPAYNGEKWVAQCIENVLCQTYKNLEVIVIDDGSTDRTAEIAAGYPVKLVRQENRGLSGARNRGIEAATGDYIHFMDVDDLINLDFYARMTEAIEFTDADMAFGGVVNEATPRFARSFFERWLMAAAEDKFGITNVGQFGSSCSYIIRRSLVEEAGLRFEPGRLMEDKPFTVHAVCEARKIVTVPGALYYYKKRTGSIMRAKDAKKALKRREDRRWAQARCRELMERYGLPEAYLQPVSAHTFQHKLFGMPLVRKTISLTGKSRWYLFGVCVMQRKELG